MGTVILIGTVAIVVAIVGCCFIWRLDASRADEVEQSGPERTRAAGPALGEGRRVAPPRALDS